jgi:hypothetical protein
MIFQQYLAIILLSPEYQLLSCLMKTSDTFALMVLDCLDLLTLGVILDLK